MAAERTASGAAIRSLARAGGFFWLITFVMGAAALGMYGSVVVAGNAAATVANLVTREVFYRTAIVSNLVAMVAYVAATILVYYLLRPVSRSVALLAAFFSLIACAIATVTFILQLAPIALLRDGSYAAVFTAEQVQEQVRMLLRVAEQANSFSFVFFGLHVLLTGVLVLRSGFIHRWIGGLLMFGGVGWLTFALANLLSPPLARALSPYVLLPGMLGEGALIVWLLVKGVDVERWTARAAAARE